MNKLQKTFASTVASSALLLNAAVPLFATTTIELSGNGAFSDNVASVTQTTVTTVDQSNVGMVSNNINVGANTGGNTTSFNSGDVAVGTGNAVSNVTVDNTLNTNAAAVDCCEAGDTSVLIQGNAAFSNNAGHLNQENIVEVDQDNFAYVKNNVNSYLNTGKNNASMNTGGDVIIGTGNAVANVSVSTTANSNVAMVGGGLGLPGTPSVSLWIVENGAYSDNMLNADLTKVVDLDQDNKAKIKNWVDAYANTGANKAKFNTGGDVIIGTGAAGSIVEIDNMVNFNYAAIDCGCTWDVLAKIAGNGAESENLAWLALTSYQGYDQDNFAKLNNWVDSYAKTGKNNASLNTGDVLSDPAIFTGASMNTVDVSNSGNVNTIGGPLVLPLPFLGTNVGFSFNLSALMAYVSLLVS